tara:strand:+ start:90 stop:371 length:282 start_codon:yes stop_codon:yes gene_type:complete
LAALGDITIKQKYIIDPSHPKSFFLHGAQVGAAVIVNEAPSIVGILLHEMIHFVRPEWSERTVRRSVTLLLRQLTHEEIQAIYEQYQLRKVDE